MKRAWTCLAVSLVAAALVLTVGCGGGDPQESAGDPKKPAGDAQKSAETRLVGVWEGQTPDADSPGGQMTIGFEFKTGGVMSMTMMGMPVPGTWKVAKSEGNNLTINTVVKPQAAAGPDDEGDTPAPEPFVAEYAIVFETDDRISLTPTADPSEALTLNRKAK